MACVSRVVPATALTQTRTTIRVTGMDAERRLLTGLYSYGLHRYGLHSHGVQHHGIYSYNKHSYGLYSYDQHSYGLC